MRDSLKGQWNTVHKLEDNKEDRSLRGAEEQSAIESQLYFAILQEESG